MEIISPKELVGICRNHDTVKNIAAQLGVSIPNVYAMETTDSYSPRLSTYLRLLNLAMQFDKGLKARLKQVMFGQN